MLRNVQGGGILLGAFLSAALCAAQIDSTSAIPLKHPVPGYPPIAKVAHISGDVVLKFQILLDGSTSDVTGISGNPILQAPAISAVKNWVYKPGLAATRQITIRFRFAESEYGDATPPLATFDDQGNAILTVETLTSKTRSHCPSPQDAIPPAGSSPSDFIELSRSGCYGSCPSYTVRIQRDGTVHWNGRSYVYLEGNSSITLSHDQVANLFAVFQTPTFWQACNEYTASITDSPTYTLAAQISGIKKEISDYASSAPPAIQSLQLLVDEATDTHRWRVGDPDQESIADIESDAYLPKPGRTGLMLAVVGDRLQDVLSALASGDKLTDVDSSGWTPLMYAASEWRGTHIKLLLSKGAAPNTRGPKGETALHFAALTGTADEDLIAAGGDVNATLSDGTTVLMVLSQRAEKDGIKSLIRAGAKATAKDVAGRTALDYLLAASCGQPILSEHMQWMTLGYSKCNAFNPKDLKASRLILEKAGARQTRFWRPKPSTHTAQAEPGPPM